MKIELQRFRSRGQYREYWVYEVAKPLPCPGPASPKYAPESRFTYANRSLSEIVRVLRKNFGKEIQIVSLWDGKERK